MRATLTAVMAFLPVIASIAHAGEVLWAEAEEYSDQHGSVGADRPPFGSRGACLGASWGGARDHYVLYRFRIDHALGDGEDFELILAAPPDEARRMIAEQPLAVPLTIIGEFVAEPGLRQRDADGRIQPLSVTGWEHDFT